MAEISRLATEMELKDDKFRQSLRQLEALAKVTKSSLQDLSNIQIGKDGKLTFNPAPIVESKKSLAELRVELSNYKQQIENAKLGSAEFGFLKVKIAETEAQIKSATQVQQGYHRELSEGEKKFRAYIAEQRLQDRAFREGTNAILGITTALTLLTQGNETTGDSVRKIERSLLATVVAINSVEFSLFALERAGTKVGGSLGRALTSISALAGPISIVVGVGAGLIAFFQEANAEAKKAAEEGLTEFKNKLEGLTLPGKEKLAKDIQSKLDAVNQAIAKNTELVQTTTPEGDVITTTMAIDEALNAKRKEIKEILETSLKEINDRIRVDNAILAVNKELNSIIESQLTGIRKINADLAELNKKKEQGILIDDNGKKIVDEIAALEEKKKALLETTDEHAERILSLQKNQYELGRITTAEYLHQLDIAKSQISDKEKLAAIEKEIFDITSGTNEQNAQAVADRKKRELDLQRTIAENSVTIEEQGKLSKAKTEQEKIAIQKQSAQLRLQIEYEYQNTVLEIEKKRINDTLPFVSTKTREQLRQQLNEIEDQLKKLKEAYKSNALVIGIKFELQSDSIPSGSILEQQKRVADAQDAYNKATDDNARELLRRRYEYEKSLLEDMQLSEEQRFQNGLEQSLRIANTLSNAFSKSGDDFLGKLSQALQIALNIAKVVQAMNKKGGGSPLDFLEIFANIVLFGKLFDEGGHTGFIDPKKPAGIVHGDEIVFENKIVKDNRAELLLLRSQLQSGKSVREAIEEPKQQQPIVVTQLPIIEKPKEEPKQQQPIVVTQNKNVEETPAITVMRWKIPTGMFAESTPIQIPTAKFSIPQFDIASLRPRLVQDKTVENFKSSIQPQFDVASLRSQLELGEKARQVIQVLAPKYLGAQSPSYTFQDLSPMLSELRALRKETQELRTAIENLPAPQVNLPKGIVTIDDALIQATPRVEKYFTQKNVD